MKTLKIVCTGIILLSSIFIYAQSEIELRTDGIVVPRTTSATVVSPIKGMLIYDTDIDGFKYYDGANWLAIGGGTGGTVTWADITGKPAGFDDNTDNINDADANASNELQTISKSGSTVTLSDSGGSFTIDDADANATNELQTISKSGSTVTLSDGGGSFTINDADASATNEIQNLKLAGGVIQLSNSTPTIPISDISPWTIDANDAIKVSGKVGIGNDDPSAKLDVLSAAGEDGLRIRIDGSTKFRVRSNGGVNIGGNPSSVPTNGLRVYGNTSLGTTQLPEEKLEVVGAINLSGNASSSNPDPGTIRWNSTTVDFEGYDGTNWKSLTGLPAPPPTPTYEVGDYEDEGVVFNVSPDGKTVKFVYIGELQSFSTWTSPPNFLIDGADSNVDGTQNSLDILNDSQTTGSAAELCLNLVAGGHSDWYLPAINELMALFDARSSINTALTSNLGDALSLFTTWSSTENNSANVWTHDGSGPASVTPRSETNKNIRAIRTVTFP